MSTLLFILVGWLIVVDFLVIFSSSKDDTPADTPAPWHPFSKLASLAQKLSSSGPHLGRAVQVASVPLSSSFSRSGLGGEARPVKFNLGVVTGGVVMNLVEIHFWRRLDCCLCQVQSLPRRFH